MTKTLRYLLVTALAAGLTGGIAWAAKGGNGGGGGKPGGGGDPSKIPVIARFDAAPPSDMVSDGAQYDSSDIGDGWVELPGTGNFTLKMGGGRSIQLDLSDTVGGAQNPGIYQDFLNANPGGIVSLDFFSINAHCLVADLLDEDHVPAYEDGEDDYYGCGNSDAAEGSLKAMPFDADPLHDHSSDLLLRFTPNISGSTKKKGRLNINCGARGGAPDPDLGGTTSFMVAHCNQSVSSSDNTCAEWRIIPYYKGAIDLGPISEGADNICTVAETVQSGNSITITPVQDFDVRFGLTVYRDENADGSPDVLPVVQ